MSGKGHPVHLIGAGPGHPRHLTREGAAALRASRFVWALPPYPETFARLLRGKEVADPLAISAAELGRRVEAQARRAPVSVLVPGDTTVFTPFLDLVARLGERSHLIPGVGVINAAAARLGISLERAPLTQSVILLSPRHLPPGREGEEALLRHAALPATLAIYMAHRSLADLSALLRRVRRPGTPVAVLHRLGLPGERILRGTLADIAERAGDDDPCLPPPGQPSLTLVLVGEALASRKDFAE